MFGNRVTGASKASKAKRQVHELKAPQERSDEETEAMPAKSVRRSGN